MAIIGPDVLLGSCEFVFGAPDEFLSPVPLPPIKTILLWFTAALLEELCDLYLLFLLMLAPPADRSFCCDIPPTEYPLIFYGD